MGATTLHSVKTKFGFVSSSHVKEFLHGNMRRFVTSFSFLISTFSFYVLVPICRRVFRFQVGNNSDDHQKDDRQVGSDCCDNSDVVDKNIEREVALVMESVPMSSTNNRYEFLSEKGISGFLEEPKTLSFTINEFFEDSDTQKQEMNSLTSDERFTYKELDLQGNDYTAEGSEKAELFDNFFPTEESLGKEEKPLLNEEIIVNDKSKGCNGFGGSTVDGSAKEQPTTEVCDAGETEELDRHSVCDAGETEELDRHSVCDAGETEKLDGHSVIEVEKDSETLGSECGSSNQVSWSPEDYSLPSESEEDASSSDDELFSSNDNVSSFTYSFLTNKIIHEGFGRLESPDFINETELANNQGSETTLESLESDEEFIELEPDKGYSVSLKDDKKLEIEKENVVVNNVELVHRETQDSGSFQDTSFQDSKTSSHDVQVETFEHEDIIEQLKEELKLARTGGLPTIQEESECEEAETPKIMQQLKPLKIDEKREYKHCMDEFQKIYKSYSDRMRKLDILNFQTMHAVGLLQMKDTIQSQRKASITTLKAIFSQPLWSCKGSAVVEPIKRAVADVHRDFEAVYVGQLCLSWEVIHWQYRKAQELHDYDPQEVHQYNQVAGEFQLFQVLLQRFIENEPFQGPRVQNYVKNRCVVRNLLQVPLIKDDSLKDKETRANDEDSISHQMLLQIIEESMQTFREFFRSDKDEFLNSQAPISFQESIDSELLLDVLNDLQKKEKKLKDITRSGNCIIKKLQRNQEERMPRTCSLFVAQVELKLISRVTSMSKLTNDQLIWCREKLGKINISNRKVLLEPSFLLLPC